LFVSAETTEFDEKGHRTGSEFTPYAGWARRCGCNDACNAAGRQQVL
jgi:hypothetical protein